MSQIAKKRKKAYMLLKSGASNIQGVSWKNSARNFCQPGDSNRPNRQIARLPKFGKLTILAQKM